MRAIHYHNGEADFPHGAGASDEGYYVYPAFPMRDEPDGPFDTLTEAVKEGGGNVHSIAMMVDAGELPDRAKDEALQLLAQQSYDLLEILRDGLSITCDSDRHCNEVWSRQPGSHWDDVLKALGIETREQFDEEI